MSKITSLKHKSDKRAYMSSNEEAGMEDANPKSRNPKSL
jgi:hypothetical protein